MMKWISLQIKEKYGETPNEIVITYKRADRGARSHQMQEVIVMAREFYVAEDGSIHSHPVTVANNCLLYTSILEDLDFSNFKIELGTDSYEKEIQEDDTLSEFEGATHDVEEYIDYYSLGEYETVSYTHLDVYKRQSE